MYKTKKEIETLINKFKAERNWEQAIYLVKIISQKHRSEPYYVDERRIACLT